MSRETSIDTSSSSNDERVNALTTESDRLKQGTSAVKPRVDPFKGMEIPPGSDRRFVTHERIGMGSFAAVYRAEYRVKTGNLESCTTVAVKVVKKAQLKRDKRILDNFESEMKIMKQLKHPHIVELYDVLQTPYDYNLIMEFCSIGDLSNVIRKRSKVMRHHKSIATMFKQFPSQEPGLNPQVVRHFLAQIGSCLKFLRENDLVHRDVKPQNLLLCPPVESLTEFKKLGYSGNWRLPVLKLADFGFARVLPPSSMAETLCGSPLYMAPEILNYEKYDAKADLWSVGAVTYEMIVGRPPFLASNHIELIRNIEKNKDKITFPFEVDKDLKTLINKLLIMNPLNRMDFTEFFKYTDEANEASEDETSKASKSNELSGIEALSSDNFNSSNVSAESSDSRNVGLNEDSTNPLRDAFIGALNSSSHSLDSNDVAVESSSPSPDSSEHTRSPRDTRRARDNEGEYVFIEKRSVEVNSLADDMQLPPQSRRHSSNSEKKSRRRRLSSILYGASPTNAMAQALLRSSARLFNTKSSAPKDAGSKASMQSDEKTINDELEQLGTIGKVVTVFAEYKFSQLVLSPEYSKFLKETETELKTESPASQPASQPASRYTTPATDASSVQFGTASRPAASGAMPTAAASTNSAFLSRSTSRPNSVPNHIHPIRTSPSLQPMSSSSLNSGHSPRFPHSPMTSASTFFFNSIKPQDIPTQMEIISEALALHLKALGILGKAMQRLSGWWEARLTQPDAKTVPSGINALVQWIRDKFNHCVERAEVEKNLLAHIAEDSGLPVPEVNVERLLFDRALELSRSAAELEMSIDTNSNQSLQNSYSTSISGSASAYNASQSLFEWGSQCQLNYGTGLCLLRAFLESEKPEDTISDDDRQLVSVLMAKIGKRLESVRQRMGSSSIHSLNQQSCDTMPSTISDSGAVFHLDDLRAAMPED